MFFIFWKISISLTIILRYFACFFFWKISLFLTSLFLRAFFVFLLTCIDDFFPNFTIFSKQFIIVYQKRHLFCCYHFWKSKLFTIFVDNKIFKTLFTKINFIRCYYFINIYIVYQSKVFVLVQFVFFSLNITECHSCFIDFYMYLKMFYNFYIYNVPFFWSNRYFALSLLPHIS